MVYSAGNKYMLIDNSGDAWITSITNKIHIGNILKQKDWNKIIKYLI